MKKRIIIFLIVIIIIAPIVLLGYLIFKNYYFPNGFSAVYDLKKESKFISPLKPLSAAGEIVDTWNPGKAETEMGTFNVETREIFQPIIDDFAYTDIFLPKKFAKLNLFLLYRADTPELKICLKTGGAEEDWECLTFYTEKQMGNWFNLGASWDLAEAYQVKSRHYRIGIFAPGLNENNGILHIKKIEIEAK